MKSKNYAIWQNGYDSMWSHEIVIGPANEALVFRAFSKFFLKYCVDFGERYVIFASPVNLDDQDPSGPVVIHYFSREEKLPTFNKDRILKALFPELKESLDVTFERIYVAGIMENLAWRNQ